MDELTATVSILDRNYSLRVAQSDLEMLRTAARRLDEMARGFGRQFPSKDHQDLISMAALLHELQLLKLQQRSATSPVDIQQRLDALNSQLDQALEVK